jgi:hypothetical protein
MITKCGRQDCHFLKATHVVYQKPTAETKNRRHITNETSHKTSFQRFPLATVRIQDFQLFVVLTVAKKQIHVEE